MEVKNDQFKKLLTKKDVMRILQVSLSSVDRWMRAGKLKAFGIEGRVYFKRTDVEAMLTPIN
ncbi:helix-turn-helix domain-containing protein [Polaribacter marinus]|nr:helix-turn-helix domain-containing protein [Polaribacter marinus]